MTGMWGGLPLVQIEGAQKSPQRIVFLTIYVCCVNVMGYLVVMARSMHLSPWVIAVRLDALWLFKGLCYMNLPWLHVFAGCNASSD